MKKILIAAFLSMASIAMAQSATPSIAGKWHVHGSMAGNDSDSDCTFTQTGADFVGTCSAGDQGSVKITGKIDGNKVTWSYAADYNGTPLTVKYEGVLADGKIIGGSTVDPFAVTGDFTATAVK